MPVNGNARVLAETQGMPRKEWLRLRRRGIGGSDAAAVAGLDPWRSPLAVYLEKVGELDDAPDEKAQERMYWGSTLEDVIAREFRRRNPGWTAQRRNAILAHNQYPYMLANLDRVCRDPETGEWGVLECKCASEYSSGEWDEDRLPDRILIQMQHYLAVTGLPFGWVAVLIGGRSYRQAHVERNEQAIGDLVRIEERFWEAVKSRTPPTIDGSESSAELLAILYPESQAEPVVDLLPDAERWIAQYQEAVEAAKTAEAKKREAQNRLTEMLGPCERGAIGSHTVIWKAVASSRLDSRRVKVNHPDLYEKYQVESSYRRFSIKEA